MLIIGGSPRQQLTRANRHNGRQGLAGRDSVLFYAIPTIARAITELRPDLRAHVLSENAGSMRP
eukprot:11172643-Lingulodinium_polyedra.AAC.1